MSVSVDNILKKKRSFILSFDQGFEHPPSQFNIHTIDPQHILKIALEGQFTGIVMHAGLAEKYHLGAFEDVPLIVKLNGRTQHKSINPVSRQICSVERAIKLGADAVGYTIYDGSSAESEMLAEFGTIVEQAHDYGIPVIAWMYPRGPEVSEGTTETIAYAARLGLELGADFVKVKYNNDPAGFDWVVRCAGQAKVLVSDSEYRNDADVLQHARDVINAGACGIAYGRTIWQHPEPLELCKQLREIIFDQ